MGPSEGFGPIFLFSRPSLKSFLEGVFLALFAAFLAFDVPSPNYRDKEKLNGLGYRLNSNMWTHSAIMLDCISGQLPFYADGQKHRYYLEVQGSAFISDGASV